MVTENLIVLFTMSLMREIEGSMALRRHITVDRKSSNVTWHLPVSKNDPAALGCQRSWGCTCVMDTVAHRDCPYNAALHQKELLLDRFGPEDLGDELPFFPYSRWGSCGAGSRGCVG